MSLATRCVACGTVFRVVQDQLKVSEGWVRCGRCGDVFNALEGLFDLERETAPAWTPSQRAALELLPTSEDEQAAQAAANPEFAADEGFETDTALATPSAIDTVLDTRVDSQIERRQSDSENWDEGVVGGGETSDLGAAPPDESDAAADAAPEPTPAFLRNADAAARWQRPRIRAALSLASGLLGLLLAAQVAIWQRDALAARWPDAASWLAPLCEPLGCQVEPLRRLDGLAVESSGLTQIDNAALYRLQVALRNRDQHPLLTPALDVTLTDSRGDIVARKVLSRTDFGGAVPLTVAAGAELSLQVMLDAGERRISGYSIEIFYP